MNFKRAADWRDTIEYEWAIAHLSTSHVTCASVTRGSRRVNHEIVGAGDADLAFRLAELHIGHPKPARLLQSFDAIELVRGVVSVVGYADVPDLTAELSKP